jgi:hypothetical protein
MKKYIVGFAITLSAVLAVACTVEDDVLEEGQLEEGEQIQYSSGTCGITW